VDERLTLLARKLGRTKREVVMQMVDYFYKSKKDPADLNDEVLKKELASGISRILKKILGNMRERETLKSRFRQVLDYYITQREALGWPVSAAKKEELAGRARQSLDNL